MKLAQWSGAVVLLIAATMALSTTGCKKDGDPQAKAKGKDQDAKKEDGKKVDDKKEGTAAKHEGWWCEEHGVPEHMCSLCNSEVAAKLKKEGDWCKIHDRAKSQCFKCDPDLYKKYEAMYVAKYNKKPEPPPKEEFEK